MNELLIAPIPAFQDNYIWLLYRNATGRAVIVDPGDAKPVIRTLDRLGLTLDTILLTHHHADHVGGVTELVEHYGVVNVFGPNHSHIPGLTKRLDDQAKFYLQAIACEFRVFTIPGHTLDHIAFYTEGLLFCGDTLFMAGCGRVFEGTYEQMYQSLQRIRELPDKTMIYCGHEYTAKNLAFAETVEPNNADIKQRIQETHRFRERRIPTVPATLDVEKKTNPFLRCTDTAVIAAAQNRAGTEDIDPVIIFRTIREWKDHF